MKAQPAHDTLCLGSGGNSTRLCLDDQYIGMVKSIQAKDWQQVFYSEAYATNGVFGLGTEDISTNSTSFLARAVALGEISDYQYSFNMAPNDTIPSQLILGEFSGNYTAETQWFNMAVGSDGWEGNVTGCLDGKTTLMPSNYT